MRLIRSWARGVSVATLIAVAGCGSTGAESDEKANSASSAPVGQVLERGKSRLLLSRGEGSRHLVSIPVGGGSSSPLTKRVRGRADVEPTVSADGESIAFARLQGNSSSIMLVGRNEEQAATVVESGSKTPVFSPSLAPDGRQIVFARDQNEGKRLGLAAIYRVNLGEGQAMDETRLSPSGPRVSDGNPTFSPDGSTIAFTVQQQSGSDIYSMSTNGRQRTNLTRHRRLKRVAASLPAFSPDGREIAFVGRRPGQEFGALWIMGSKGERPVRVRAARRIEATGQPAFLRPGRRLVVAGALARARNPRPGVYMVPLDGERSRRISQTSSSDLDPAFVGR